MSMISKYIHTHKDDQDIVSCTPFSICFRSNITSYSIFFVSEHLPSAAMLMLVWWTYSMFFSLKVKSNDFFFSFFQIKCNNIEVGYNLS